MCVSVNLVASASEELNDPSQMRSDDRLVAYF